MEARARLGMHRWLRWLVWGAAGVLLLAAAWLVALISTWSLHVGWVGAATAAARMLLHGDTTVYDFRLYPARALEPAAKPLPFASPRAGSRPRLQLADGSSAGLDDLLRRTHTLAFVLVRRDAIEHEYYAPGHGPAALSQYFSVSKSVLATLVGMAIDDGRIRSLDQRLSNFVPELAGRGLQGTTLRQLIDMTSGLDYEENDDPFGLHVLMNYTSDLERLLLQFRGSGDDAAAFRYRSGETALLSLALQRALGPTPLTTYAQQRLWTPLGMEHGALWSLDHEGGLEKAWCCLAGTARDLAKLGRLYLAGGLVGAVQVLPSGWIAQSAPRPAVEGQRVYTHGWWPGAPGSSDFAAIGKDGQFLYVSRQHDTVIVRLGERLGLGSMAEWLSLFGQLAAQG